MDALELLDRVIDVERCLFEFHKGMAEDGMDKYQGLCVGPIIEANKKLTDLRNFAITELGKMVGGFDNHGTGKEDSDLPDWLKLPDLRGKAEPDIAG